MPIEERSHCADKSAVATVNRALRLFVRFKKLMGIIVSVVWPIMLFHGHNKSVPAECGEGHDNANERIIADIRDVVASCR